MILEDWVKGHWIFILSPLVKYFFTDRSKAVLLWIIYAISVLFLLCFRARLFIDALWSPADIGLTYWLSFVISNCEAVTSPLVSWVRCGAWLYWFLIFALFLTLLYLNNLWRIIITIPVLLKLVCQIIVCVLLIFREMLKKSWMPMESRSWLTSWPWLIYILPEQQSPHR